MNGAICFIRATIAIEKKNAFFPLRNDRNRARNHKLDEKLFK